jgi:RNA polymerase sigma-54 factor
MKPTLQLRLTQQLALTPQLQQSIRLLQLSTLELHQELEQALADNPLLERLDDPLGACMSISSNGALDGVRPYNGTESSQPEPGGDRAAPAESDSAGDGDRNGEDRAGDWGNDRFTGDGSGDGFGRGRGESEDDERHVPQVAAAGGSLREHLMNQLSATQCTARDRGLVTLLIDEVNNDGYLELELSELARIVPAELEFEAEELSAALGLLQSFDPVGVGARSVSECLQLQLASPEVTNGHGAAAIKLARTLVAEYLPLLAAKDFVRLKRALRCDDDELRAGQKLIRALNPRPGAIHAVHESNFVVPDVVVKKTRTHWQATLNPEVMPKLRINDMYAQILKRNRNGHAGLSGQLQEARWLIKNVQQRFDTILRVAQAIVDRQRSFFSHGAVAMRPLVLREIADAIGLHESTVSRVTTQKYMLTPFGTFELKYFFGSHVATDSGGAASSTAIRELLKQLISAEDSKNPISDSRIAELLGEQGIMVARRTVAKYREGMRIPAVSQRKAL